MQYKAYVGQYSYTGDVGAYVVTGALSFAFAVVITVLCINYRIELERYSMKKSEEEVK